MDDNDDIVFDRDTSAPKKKLKDKIRKKIKSTEENENNNNNNNIILSKNLLNNDDYNNNKNLLINKNKIKIENSNSLPQSTDILHINGNNIKDGVKQNDINNNIKREINNNLNSAGEIKSFNDYDKFLKEYNEAMKSGDKDRIIIVLKKRIEYMELNINDLNLLIDHLRQDIHNKENVIHLLTQTNTTLRESLNSFSKRLDDKILEKSRKSKVKSDKISKSLNKSSSKKTTRKNLSRNGNGLTNALTMNRILQKDNDNLKNIINNYGSVDRMKELENMNKLFKDENNRWQVISSGIR